MISERYKKLRFNQGREVERKRIKEILEQLGVELTPEVKEKLFGKTDEKPS